ncbi:putative racemase [Providencia alcalifaciens]|nr:putative racemase [Providencia alcalifaciens]
MPLQIEEKSKLPFLHIADATGEKITQSGIKTIGLLGTAFTMEQAFYKDRLTDKFNLRVITPNEADRKIVHDIIYHELCLGIISDTSHTEYQRIMKTLVEHGAEGIILGCTEITLLVNAGDTSVPVFDTTAIHAQCAVEYALKA